jgi:uncharacterized protein with GYD domain
MPLYIVLHRWTDAGIGQVTETLERVEQNRRVVDQMGGRMSAVYWTQGRYDVVVVLEAPDDETAAAITLRVGAAGKARTETLRAFDIDGMGRILKQLG